MADIRALRKNLIGKAKKQVQEKYSGRETHVIRATAVLQDLDACFNLLAEQCIEWYAMHFPELQKLVKDNQTTLKLIYFVGERKNFTEKKVAEHEEKNVKKVVETAKKSMGSDFEETAMKEIQLLALNALNIKEERDYLLKFIENEMVKVASNFAKVAGTMLAARLLDEAGSLKKLAFMPSSTMQVLGAEKALFRHLRNKQAKPPKHGLIFMHPFVQKVPKNKRGKMARAIAGKLCIAAKEDFFGKKDISKNLDKSLQARFAQLNKTKN